MDEPSGAPARPSERVTVKTSEVFGAARLEEALRLLAEIGPSDDGTERVQLGVLKLSEGDVERLRRWVATARIDRRDVIAAAEYPRQLALPPGEITAEAIAADRRDYQRWLEGGDG